MSIMTSHEEYCEALKLAVVGYTLEELYEYHKAAEAKRECADYANIYEQEIKNRGH